MRKFTLQTYGLSVIWTFECFFLSDELANRRSHPAYSHLNGFSPEIIVNIYFLQKSFLESSLKKWKNYLCEFSYEFSNFHFGQSFFHNLDMDKWMVFLQCELWYDWQACIWLWKRYDFWNIRPSSKCGWYFLNFGFSFWKNLWLNIFEAVHFFK